MEMKAIGRTRRVSGSDNQSSVHSTRLHWRQRGRQPTLQSSKTPRAGRAQGDVALLLAGDVEALAEAQLAQGARTLRAQLLKAGHHGSRTSSTDAFLRAVAPETVVFSMGLQNPFGFPHADVVARAEALGARTMRTDQGAVIAVSDGHNLRARSFAPP